MSTPDPQPASTTASYVVYASSAQDVELADITGPSIQEIADAVDAAASDVSVCHQCAHDISDPELGEMRAMTVNGVYYERGDDDGVWREAQS